MPPTSRAGFLSLVWRFLAFPTVWIGGVAAAMVLLFGSDVWPGIALPGAIIVGISAVWLEVARDRHRGIGRRLLFRGASVSPRRTVALVVAVALVASASATLVSRMGMTIRKGIENEVRSRSSPNFKRGYY